MKTKNAILALALLSMPLGVVSCGNENVKAPEIKIGDNGNWFVDGTDTGQSSKGEDGTSSSVTIGDNGNWFIDGKDTGLSSKGDNAYEIFKKEHPDVNITEEEWLHDYIKGDLDKYTYQKVKFVNDGKVYKEFKVDYNTQVPSFPDPRKDDMEFSGWYDSKGNKFTNQNIVDDVTYYANYKKATSSSDRSDLQFNDVVMPARPTGLNAQNLANNPQDGTILHAWSWNLQEIKKEMKNIAAAGYSSVQTSPMQPQKDYYPGNSIKWWWKVYQPLGFEVAKKNNALGTKQDLIELCNEADKYGVKVIVDVVANHLAGGSETTMNHESQEYEPEIYNNNLMHVNAPDEHVDDADAAWTTKRPLGGYPDVKTEDPRVQRAILGLLNEYVECGVDGFRFDAAKHIETPYDRDDVKSDLWTIAIKGSAKHAMDLGKNVPYSYGEILGAPGNERPFDWYINDDKVGISVTDNYAANQALAAVRNHNGYGINKVDIYNPGMRAEKAVLWGESHDTYANDNRETTDVPQNEVNKAYAINASRQDAASLYFIRPHEFSDEPNAMRLGGRSYNDHWKSHVITEVNKFHNNYINGEVEEYIDCDDPHFFTNYKKVNGKYGAMVVSLTDKNVIDKTNAINTKMHLGEGRYFDAVSKNEFVVKSGFLKGTMDKSGIACLYQIDDVQEPVKAPVAKVTLSDEGTHYHLGVDEVNVNMTLTDTSNAWYQTNDEIGTQTKHKFSGPTSITLRTNAENDDQRLRVFIENDHVQYTYDYTYKFEDEVEGKKTVIVRDIPKDFYDGYKIVAWTWNKNGDGHWVTGKLKGNDFVYRVNEDVVGVKLAKFSFSTPDDAFDWDTNVLFETNENIELVPGIPDYYVYGGWKQVRAQQ